MARRLFCKLTHERNEKFSVGGTIYTIGADGFVEVSDDHAPLLLQNKAKWVDPATEAPTPFKRPSGPPQPILEDKATGRELTDDEVSAIVASDVAKEPTAPEAEPEPAPEDWPQVSSESSKKDLLAVCARLKAAGHITDADYSDKLAKMDLLEVIERAYDAMG